MINKELADKLIQKYCPSVKLTITDRYGKEGLYLQSSNEIIITEDWTIAGLLHEITHAKLYLEQDRVGHDGVFADTFTKIVSEVFEKSS